jgi:isopenicillin N synthase-like dioxygenase
LAASTDLMYPNKWPREESIPGFRSSIEKAFLELEKASLTILEALELAFGVPRGAILSSFRNNASEMRLLRYPQSSVAELTGGQVSRIWPHFDLGVVTLLFQDGLVGGLEFENRESSGEFYPVEYDTRSDMIINIAESLQRMTNDKLMAGLHRVTLPQSFDSEDGIIPERYSITYFCKADRSASVGVIKEFLEADEIPKYEDITAIDYHQSRLQSAY